jgi:hypothetical protein
MEDYSSGEEEVLGVGLGWVRERTRCVWIVHMHACMHTYCTSDEGETRCRIFSPCCLFPLEIVQSNTRRSMESIQEGVKEQKGVN